MGKAPFDNPFDLSLSIPRRWKLGYVIVLPMLLAVALLSSLKSWRMLRGVEVSLEHRKGQHGGIGQQKFITEDSEGSAELFESKLWQTPLPFSEEYFVRRGSDFAKRQSNHSWLQPLVFLAHVRRSKVSDRHSEVFLYMTGVSMGHFKRGFRIMGCVVGRDVYPVVDAALDVAMCNVPRIVKKGEMLSVAVSNDRTLQTAMKGPVELQLGLRAELKQGDIIAVPDGVKSHIDNVGTGELMAVKSVAKAEAEMAEVENEDMETRARYEVCIVTQMKPYPHLLGDWIDYHRRLGVDMVYVLDNGSKEDLGATFSGRRDVEVLFWPWGRSQVQAVSWFLIAGRRSCEWILFTDADEYLMFGIGKDMGHAGKRVLKRFVNTKREQGYQQLFFRFIIMGQSGHARIPKDPLPEAYTYVREGAMSNGKAICQTDADWFVMRVHWAKGFSDVKSYQKKEKNRYPVEPTDDPSLVHFQFRSWEELAIKKRTGSPSINDRHGSKTRIVRDSPPAGYLMVNERQRYTHFRGIWREVTTATGLNEQTLVRYRHGIRCTVVRELDGHEHSFRDENCEEV